MSQAKLKSLEGQKEVRHTCPLSFPWETCPAGLRDLLRKWWLTRLCLRLCDSCGPLDYSSLLHAKPLEAWAWRASPEQVCTALLPVSWQAGCHCKKREAGVMGQC